MLATDHRPSLVSDPAKDKLDGLLSYVEQVVRLDERPAFRLSEHRLSTGQALTLHQHELQALPGIRHDLADEDGAIWLAVERLRRGEPPAPPEAIAAWLDVSPDPDVAPAPRADRIVTVPAREKDALVTKGAARPEDCAAALGPDVAGQFDVRLRLEDRPQLRTVADTYIAEQWLPWAEAERPRRRSIAIYQKLFEIAQLADLVADQPFELVWGLGLTRWRRDGFEVDLPLIERLVEIEIDEAAAGEIRIRPRAAPTVPNLRPYEEMRLDGAALAADAARRAIAAAGEDGVSPFLKESFEPALRACQSRLDAAGRYLPDHVVLEPSAPVPPAGEHLVVSDRWVLFARRRSDNVLLADLANLKGSVADKAERGDLPGPARTLVLGPQERPDDAWRPLSAGLGETDHAPAPADDEGAPAPDLFFPKPFNDEQIEIVRRLEQSDGIVVQGPPGTGKTHTIANIVCHYLATGRRVLVVSHGEPALAVLRSQLPDSVRDLAISITATEREGFRQLETAVRLLQSIAEGVKPSEQTRLIKDVETAILGLRERLAAVDRDIASVASTQLAAVPGFDKTPAELASFVAGARASFDWFTDRPEHPAASSGLSDEAIADLRAARVALGARLEHLEAVLPSINDLPDGDSLGALHDDLVRAAEFGERAAQDQALTIRIRNAEALEQVTRAVQALQTLAHARALVDAYPWLEKAAADLLAGEPTGTTEALKAFAADAEPVLAERARYLTRPVDVPDAFPHTDETVALIARLAQGEEVFGFFAFKEKALRPAIELLRVVGRAPADASDWAHVGDHLRWREQVWSLEQRWTRLAAEIDAPGDVSSARGLEDLLDVLQPVLVQAPAALTALEDAFREVVFGPQDARSLWFDRERRIAVEDALRNAGAAARLSAAEAEVKRLVGLFPAESGKLGKLARDLLREAVGRATIDAGRVATLWDTLRQRIDDLASHRQAFDVVAATAQMIAAAGAPQWALRLTTEPAGESDALLPGNWRDAWDWAAAEGYLRRIDGRDRLSALSAERVRLDRDIARSFERLVRERTFYALARSMTGPIKSALMMFATALRRTGKGTGKGAVRHRRDARAAMAQCYGAIPCWIMPSWRVAEQLPGELGCFDLVIMDEASQSDIREVTTLLRGRKVLVVGDDKQVSPTAAFIEDAKIQRLEHGFLSGQPFKTLLLPGSSLYDLAKVMFPDKLVMLKEHFRCVEPIIRFSMQFYPEPLIPLRVPAAHERLDPPLIDVYVPDGRRDRTKINPREARVVVDEIKAVVADERLARVEAQDHWRTIGVISLIGAPQAALINRMLIDELGEEVMLRHRIVCGDSATLQGNERDIVFLSMVADPVMKQAQTAAHFEQRFNVALSRARDRLVLVRSVQEDQLNPLDLKAKVIRHFREPMAGAARPVGELEERCESPFEREVFRRLGAHGYRVTPQVGSLGYRIDLVVEGSGDRRLAVECDGDQHHGPERWADDMRRQRILERVGWRFWRCWASSFTLDPDACMADLFATLTAMGIEPVGAEGDASVYTLHKVAQAPSQESAATAAAADSADAAPAPEAETVNGAGGIRVGDRIVVRYLDDNKSATLTLSREQDDPSNGILAATSPLGRELLGAAEEDEVEFETGGRARRVLVVRTERGAAPLPPP